jgi:16S rRNA (uracil1498-N3)-methyltransferase
MPRLFLLDSEVQLGIVTLRDEKARYLSTVLRCRKGDPLIIKDNKGSTFAARITGIAGKEVTVQILERQQLDTESPIGITLLQGILKGEKMDFVIQKATELGVREILPVATQRSQVRETRKLPRWRKIAEEASRQSGRDMIPLIREPAEFSSLFGGTTPHPGSGIVFWEQGGEDLRAALNAFRGARGISLFTGPEGGFSEGEIRRASEGGFVAATLGKRILRAETAAVAAVSIVQFVLGDLGTSSQ